MPRSQKAARAWRGLLAAADAPAQLRIDWVQALAAASGAAGMCGGQALYIDATGQGHEPVARHPRLEAGDADPAPASLVRLERMHALKTGALIRAAVRMGALGGGADAATLAQLDRYASALGLAFQIRDDLLDIEASSEQLGKTAGKDVAQAKATYPALLGLQGARARLDELAATMRDALAPLGSAAAHLAALGERAVHRSH